MIKDLYAPDASLSHGKQYNYIVVLLFILQSSLNPFTPKSAMWHKIKYHYMLNIWLILFTKYEWCKKGLWQICLLKA